LPAAVPGSSSRSSLPVSINSKLCSSYRHTSTLIGVSWCTPVYTTVPAGRPVFRLRGFFERAHKMLGFSQHQQGHLGVKYASFCLAHVKKTIDESSLPFHETKQVALIAGHKFCDRLRNIITDDGMHIGFEPGNQLQELLLRFFALRFAFGDMDDTEGGLVYRCDFQ